MRATRPVKMLPSSAIAPPTATREPRADHAVRTSPRGAPAGVAPARDLRRRPRTEGIGATAANLLRWYDKEVTPRQAINRGLLELQSARDRRSSATTMERRTRNHGLQVRDDGVRRLTRPEPRNALAAGRRSRRVHDRLLERALGHRHRCPRRRRAPGARFTHWGKFATAKCGRFQGRLAQGLEFIYLVHELSGAVAASRGAAHEATSTSDEARLAARRARSAARRTCAGGFFARSGREALPRDRADEARPVRSIAAMPSVRRPRRRAPRERELRQSIGCALTHMLPSVRAASARTSMSSLVSSRRSRIAPACSVARVLPSAATAAEPAPSGSRSRERVQRARCPASAGLVIAPSASAAATRTNVHAVGRERARALPRCRRRRACRRAIAPERSFADARLGIGRRRDDRGQRAARSGGELDGAHSHAAIRIVSGELREAGQLTRSSRRCARELGERLSEEVARRMSRRGAEHLRDRGVRLRAAARRACCRSRGADRAAPAAPVSLFVDERERACPARRPRTRAEAQRGSHACLRRSFPELLGVGSSAAAAAMVARSGAAAARRRLVAGANRGDERLGRRLPAALDAPERALRTSGSWSASARVEELHRRSVRTRPRSRRRRQRARGLAVERAPALCRRDEAVVACASQERCRLFGAWRRSAPSRRHRVWRRRHRTS